MSLRFDLARAASVLSTEALKHVFRRPAANFPGKAGLVIDPQLITHLRLRIREGSVVVVGTNGKTTVTNLLADALEVAGKTVACNRTGANLDSGVATALLHTRTADWGVFESDELWLARILPQLRPDYVVLLNLFRDQLDRAGEIDHVRESIARALAASPKTMLIYNADDPFCQAIADTAANRHVAFGISEDLNIPQNTITDAGVCQHCDSMLTYAWRQYGQLGNYSCPNCGFSREEPHYQAHDVSLGNGTSFTVRIGSETASPRKTAEHVSDPHGTGISEARLHSTLPGAYTVYNLLALCAAADCCGVPFERVNRAVRAFSPRNGRLQAYDINGHRVLLNLAKNPTGFNQNLRIVLEHPGPKAVAFFINDKEADGRDVSWLWDVDFQELAADHDLLAFAGGLRRNDMQVRLKYAGIEAQLVDGARDFLEIASASMQSDDATFFLIANYTALPGVQAELDRMQRESGEPDSDDRAGSTGRIHTTIGDGNRTTSTTAMRNAPIEQNIDLFTHRSALLRLRECTENKEAQAIGQNHRPLSDEPLVIAHLYPELLNLYGDGGNVTILAARARARGMQVEIARVPHGHNADLERADIVFLGGGPDREQHLASTCLLNQADALRAYVEDDGVLLAICGGFQVIGHEWLLDDESVPGLGLIDITTKRAEGGSHNRIVGNVVMDSPLASLPVVGYENHAGRTFLGAGCKPFGRISGKRGTGNNDTDRVDGALYRNVVGTYLHGPLLAKNPEIADHLITRALARRAAKEGRPAPMLPPLDDSIEQAANARMAQ